MLKENPLSQIRSNQLHEEGQKNLQIEYALYWKYEGVKCKKCGVVQGKQRKGFKKFYCEHYINKIERKTKPLWKNCHRLLGCYLSSIIPDKINSKEISSKT